MFKNALFNLKTELGIIKMANDSNKVPINTQSQDCNTSVGLVEYNEVPHREHNVLLENERMCVLASRQK